MKILWKDLIASETGFNELARAKGLGARLSAIVGRNFRLFRQAFKEYEEAREKCLLEHGEAVKDGPPGQVHVPKEKVKDFLADMKEMDDSETEVDFHTIKFSELEQRGVDISPQVFADLHWLIEGADQ